MVRIGGLASGMDIDTMVSDLMKAERIPLNKLKQKKQILEWQREDYRSMNTLLLNFRTELTTMKLSSTFRSRGTTSTDESKITATATSAASLASYSISKVDQLATAASRVSAAISPAGSRIDTTKSLAESTLGPSITWQTDGAAESQSVAASVEGTAFKLNLKDGVQVNTDGVMNVRVNGTTYNVVNAFSTGTTNKEVKIDADGNLTFSSTIAKDSTIKVDYIASHRVQEQTITSDSNSFTLSADANHISSKVTEIKVTSGTTVQSYTVDANNNILDGSQQLVGSIGADGTVNFTSDSPLVQDAKVQVSYKQAFSTFSIKTYGESGEKTENFSISGTESLNALMNKVNSSSAGVTMFYDSFSDKMTLTRKETGDFNKTGEEIITTGDLINNIFKFGTSEEKGGTNAKFTINGLETERTSNTFEISGVTFSLKKIFSDTPASINISNNTDQIFNNIKSFVEKYNELIGKMQAKVQEDRYKDYTPLTDEQREALSEKQQEQWEEKAKSGLLRRDPTLSSLLTKMRLDFGNPVSNESVNTMYKQLSTIGIKTSVNYLEGGKLIINEAELKKAIEADPTSVEKLFNATGTASGEKGIAERLTDTINVGLEKLRSKAGNAFTTNKQFEIGKLLVDIDNKINRFENRLTRVEDRYWKQFTAMEKAIQRSNEQMAQLMNFSSY